MLKTLRLDCVTLFMYGAFIASSSIAHASEIKLSFIGDNPSQAFLGVQQGIDEANIQGAFLGQNYNLTIKPSSSVAIFAAVEAKYISQLSKAYPKKIIFNLTEEDNYLRTECFANVLHIPPSKAMKDDAKSQWLKKHPHSEAKAQTWHSSFRKYAAGQLNSRFTQSYAHEMTDTAWAGWAAVKLLTDSIARHQLDDSASLLRYLKTELAFDGQKGISLSFRETGQLRQPLLLIENGKIAGEAPVRGVTKTINLDSLGLTHCPK